MDSLGKFVTHIDEIQLGEGCKQIANTNNYAFYIPTYICERIEHLTRMSNRQQGQSVIVSHIVLHW